MEKPGSKHINELIRLAIIGDGASFTELWDTHIGSLKQYLTSTINGVDSFMIDDICSRSFEKAFRQIQTFEPDKGSFLTWLKKISFRTALDTLETERRFSGPTVSIERGDNDVAMIDNIPDQVDNPLDSIIKGEDNELTRNCIDALPELYREVASKRFLDGLKYNEIAEELEMELNTVRTRIRRAKALMDQMKSDS